MMQSSDCVLATLDLLFQALYSGNLRKVQLCDEELPWYYLEYFESFLALERLDRF